MYVYTHIHTNTYTHTYHIYICEDQVTEGMGLVKLECSFSLRVNMNRERERSKLPSVMTSFETHTHTHTCVKGQSIKSNQNLSSPFHISVTWQILMFLPEIFFLFLSWQDNPFKRILSFSFSSQKPLSDFWSPSTFPNHTDQSPFSFFYGNCMCMQMCTPRVRVFALEEINISKMILTTTKEEIDIAMVTICWALTRCQALTRHFKYIFIELF